MTDLRAIKHRTTSAALLALAAIALTTPSHSRGQPIARPSQEDRRTDLVAASAEMLWIARVGDTRTMLFTRRAGDSFDYGPLITHRDRRVAHVAALGLDLVIWFNDGSVYRYFAEPQRDASPEAMLPDGAIPLDVVGDEREAYAIVPMESAAALPVVQNASEDGERKLDPASATLAVAAYDRRSWQTLVALPDVNSDPSSPRHPRLCSLPGRLLLFVSDPGGQAVVYYEYDSAEGKWSSGLEIPTGPIGSFWPVLVSNVPTLVVTSSGGDGSEKLSVFRLLGTGMDLPSWRAATPDYSQLPEEILGWRYRAAFGFNQHLGLLAVASDNRTFLQFARIGGPPALETEPISGIAEERDQVQQTEGLLQMFTLAILVAVLTGLFVFRRGSMVTPALLRPGRDLAFTFQRLIGWLIDFVPFSLSAAIALDISWTDGLSALTSWGVRPDPEAGFPEKAVLIWWGLSVGGHALYALIMEMLVGRTVGKLLTGIRLETETGTRPLPWQIVTRNLSRLIEMMPQFWIFGILVLVSRNRQRMGDIFARTVATRTVRITSLPGGTDPHRPGSASDPDEESAGNSASTASPTDRHDDDGEQESEHRSE